MLTEPAGSLHLCSRYLCPWCRGYFWQPPRGHLDTCADRPIGARSPRDHELEIVFDARWPLLREWKPIMAELPKLNADLSAEMVVAPGLVWYCAKGSSEVTILPSVQPSGSPTFASAAQSGTENIALAVCPASPAVSSRLTNIYRHPHPVASSSASNPPSRSVSPFEVDSPTLSENGSGLSPVSDYFMPSPVTQLNEFTGTLQLDDFTGSLGASLRHPIDALISDRHISEYNMFSPAADVQASIFRPPLSIGSGQYYPALHTQPESVGIVSGSSPGTDNVFGSFATCHRPPVATPPAQQYQFGGQCAMTQATEATDIHLGAFQSSEQDVANWALLELFNLTQPAAPMHSSTPSQMPVSSAPPQHIYHSSVFDPPPHEWSSLNVPRRAAVPRPAALSPTTQAAPMIPTLSTYSSTPATLGKPTGSSMSLQSTGQSTWTIPTTATPPHSGHLSDFLPVDFASHQSLEITSGVRAWDPTLSFDPAFSIGQ